MNLRDILYFDFDKAASLVSQLEGGLSKERAESSEGRKDERNIRKYELLKVFKAEFGGIQTDKKSVLETKILHHDLLVRLEETLISLGFAINVSESMGSAKDCSVKELHTVVSQAPYIKVEGWCAFEDYRKIYASTEKFNDLMSFIKRSELNTVLDMDSLKSELDIIEEESGKNSKKFKAAKVTYRNTERKIEGLIGKSQLPEWLFAGIRLWIDTLIKDRLNLRVCPFEEHPTLEVIANLKRACFVDDDLTHLMYGYGSEPNQKLCVLGLVTSIPPEDEAGVFNMYPDSQEESEQDEDNVDTVEKSFRAIFPALRGMEKFTSFHRYPRVIVHPIAVYRNIKSEI